MPTAFPEILTACRFYLELKLDGSDDSVDGYFSECQGFQVSQAVIEACEVTPQTWGKSGTSIGRVVRTKIPGNVTYTNLILRRGLTVSATLWNWMETVGQGNWSKQRRDGSLVVYNQAAEAQFRLEFQAGLPMRYSITDLSAAEGGFVVEELEVAVEGLKRVAVN